ncbi:MAG: tRNA (guanosine(37)-N1)-methyltransferase TrmD, partial [Candidatus Colwellbacteria bacterium]|nr:tRNA (guanosine(37)-N1)-methyltransferase TrmD [Candidatus Colwellbacteria bacterium]
VMSVEPIARAVAQRKGEKPESKTRTILMSARGKQLDEKVIRRLLAYDRLILICGRYEGVDERVAKYVADEEVSIGPYILAGGELPALALAEAVSRHIPGVLGADESLESVKGSYPVYTRPEAVEIEGKKRRVPRELLSGNHTEIAEWRKMYCARAREDRRRVV